ncbi:hypothetical protein UO65_4079 [Actinokineospora spheciospongiae]|uniref:Uncharacterized protein n=1 Tax=Actinokineospora spheciospongiae TaxID=909613 RepID=W7IIU1_9PSEU|nr:DUF6081 family protein [Actinokineospora spheciospongiae]EWC60655.1 hypothetical protein UO65_4079 [Actinokineospora spheciospongiae]
MTTNRRTATQGIPGAAGPDAAPAPTARASAPPAPFRVVWDDFSRGLRTEGPDAKWVHLPFGPTTGRDGVITTSPRGLRVRSSGINPATGEPAFTATVAQDDPGGFPGTLDHVKWLVYANRTSSGGTLGFDTGPGYELSCETNLSGRTYGVGRHPFGARVPSAEDDPRLASAALAMQDLATDVAFEFALTNESVYAYYERLPNSRGALGNYASFLYAIPVGRRSPDQTHHLRLAHDHSRGLVRWFLDGREVFRLDRIGHHLPPALRRHLVQDHGGVEETVRPDQLAVGMGLFNFLDGAAPGRPGSGLVRLSTATDYYYDPVTGPPTPLTFADDRSLEANRLFGQGASLRMDRLVVAHRPAAW